MKKGILLTAIITLLIGIKVNASQQVTKWAVMYTDASRTIQGTSATLTSNLDMNYTTTKFYWPNNNTNVYEYQGGYVIIPFTLQTPMLGLSNTNDVYGTDECSKWKCANYETTVGTCARYTCETWATGQDSQIQDREYIAPTTALKAKLYTKHNDISYNVACIVEHSSFKCPINYGVDYMDYIQIESNVNYASNNITKQYKIEITNFIIVEYDTTSQIIENQNSNTQAIINQNATYTETPSENINGTNEMEDYSNQEEAIINSLNFTALDNYNVDLDTNTSSFIWDIVEALRGVSTKIVAFMTSILALGIFKMILNR